MNMRRHVPAMVALAAAMAYSAVVADTAVPTCSIDTAPVEGGLASGLPLALKGWFFVTGTDETVPVAVRFERADGLLYQRPLYGDTIRDDVAKVLNLPQPTAVHGFSATLDTAGWQPGRYAASIVQYTDSRQLVCASPYVLTIR